MKRHSQVKSSWEPTRHLKQQESGWSARQTNMRATITWQSLKDTMAYAQEAAERFLPEYKEIYEFSKLEGEAKRSIAILTITRKSGEGEDRSRDSSISGTKLSTSEKE